MKLFVACANPGCKTGLPGIIIPIASFKAKNAPPYMPRGHAIMADIRICESCAVNANIHTLVNDKRWSDICHQIAAAGGTEPDRDTLVMILGSPKDQPLPKVMADGFKRLRKDNTIV